MEMKSLRGSSPADLLAYVELAVEIRPFKGYQTVDIHIITISIRRLDEVADGNRLSSRVFSPHIQRSTLSLSQSTVPNFLSIVLSDLAVCFL